MREFLSSIIVGAVTVALLPSKAPPAAIETHAPVRSDDLTEPATVATVANPDDQAVALLAPEPAAVSPPTLVEQMLAENNRLRAIAGKPPQTLDPRLCQAAEEQAKHVASKNYTYTSSGDPHTLGNGTVRTRAARYGFHGDLGENAHGNRHDLETAFENWHNSPGHARTLYGNYDRVGFGMATSDQGNKVWFAVYGNEAQQGDELQLLRAEVAELRATNEQLRQQLARHNGPAQKQQQAPTQAPASKAHTVRYYSPQQTYSSFSSCSGPGCGSSGGRRGLFGRR